MRRAWIGREGEGTRGAHPRREVATSRGWRHGRSAPRLRTTRPPATAVSGNHNRWEKNGQSSPVSPSRDLVLDWISQTTAPTRLNQE